MEIRNNLRTSDSESKTTIKAVPGKRRSENGSSKNDRIREYEKILLPTMQKVSRKAHFRSFQAIYSCMAWKIFASTWIMP